jgi:hypothetical protein
LTAIPRSASYTPSEWGARFHARREEEVFGAGAAGPGKALALDTIVPTPKGLRLLEDVHPGDEVFGISGSRCAVLGETPVQLDRPCYELTIHGQTIVADAEHEWITTGDHRFAVKTTKEIHESVFRMSIPVAGVADFGPPKALKLDPYVLGVCLVLGQPKDRSKFTGWDLELYSEMLKVGYTLDEVSYRVSQIRERRDVINQLVPESGRRIPNEYLAGSFNQRMALVEGIMDGGGGSGPTVGASDLPFLTDFLALASSLGLGALIRKGFRHSHGKGYHVQLQSKQFRCSRRTQGKPHKTQERTRHEVVEINRCPSVPVKCIQVKGGTFCITPAYLPTHNSMVLLTDPLEQVWVEHIRCQQSNIPDAFPGDVKAAIKENPLRWGYSEGWALHLRRTLTRLGETIERAHRMFPLIDPDVDWNEKKSIFTFSSGFKFQFGHCKDRNDYNNYLGQQYTHIAFDELIEFMKKQYDFICSRNRTGDPVLRLMLKKRACSNPKMSDAKGENIEIDDPGWVKRYFVDPAPEGNKILRKRIVLKSGEVVHTRRLFLPATLYDNPDKDFVRQYEIELRSKPKHIQECYLFGRWDSVIGSFFEDSWNPDIHRCRPFKIPQHWPIFRSLDWGYVSHGNLGYYAVDPALDTAYKFWECTFQKKKVTEFVKTVMRPFEEANKLWNPFGGSLIYGPADTQIWEERGETAKSKYAEFVECGVDWCYADKRSREDNAQRVHERLNAHENFSRPPGLIIFENCKSTLQVLPAMQTDVNKPTEPAKGGFDHPYDETSYAMAYLHGRILDPPNYKGRVVEKDDEEPQDAGRGSFGYWQG